MSTKYLHKTIFCFIALTVGSFALHMGQVYAAGLSTPSDSYVLVQDKMPAFGSYAQFRLLRQSANGDVQPVWSSGPLNVDRHVSLMDSQFHMTSWPGRTSIFSKSIVLKNSATNDTTDPVVLVGYPSQTRAKYGSMALIQSEKNTRLGQVHVLDDYSAMSRLSSDHALVIHGVGKLAIVDSAGKIESLYDNQNARFVLNSPIDIEVIDVQLKSKNSYKDAAFNVAYLDDSQLFLVNIDTSKVNGTSIYGASKIVGKPYKVLVQGEYIYVFYAKPDASTGTGHIDAVTVYKINQPSVGISHINLSIVSEFKLVDALQSPNQIFPRGSGPSPSVVTTFTSEILGLQAVPQSRTQLPSLLVRHSDVEYVYIVPKGHFTFAPLTVVSQYSSQKYIHPQQRGSAAIPVLDYSVIKDTDPVPGSLLGSGLAPVRAVAPQQLFLDKESQRFGVNLLEAVRTQRAGSGAVFQPTGDAQVDTQTLLTLFRDDLKKVAPKQAVALESKTLEELTFSMHEFVALINATPRFKFLLQSHLNFRQRDALGFFWDFNGIRSHNFIPTESERVGLSQVIAELLRGDSNAVPNTAPNTEQCAAALASDKI